MGKVASVVAVASPSLMFVGLVLAWKLQVEVRGLPTQDLGELQPQDGGSSPAAAGRLPALLGRPAPPGAGAGVRAAPPVSFAAQPAPSPFLLLLLPPSSSLLPAAPPAAWRPPAACGATSCERLCPGGCRGTFVQVRTCFLGDARRQQAESENASASNPSCER